MYTRRCDRFNLLKKKLVNMDKAKVSIIFMRPYAVAHAFVKIA